MQQIYEKPGGLSGRPLARSAAPKIIRHLYRQTRGALPIIGVGGIFDAADAWEKITAGASLVQIYTALVYRGPGVVKEIVRGLRDAAGTKRFQRTSPGGRDGEFGMKSNLTHGANLREI